MGLRGKYFSPRDMRLMHSLNAELMGSVAEVLVDVFKISVQDTITNIYGETSVETGKIYLPAIRISTLVDRPEMEALAEDFGPDRNQSHIFKFREKMCVQLNFLPQIGDIVHWNDRYWEIDNVVREQLLGGQSDKSWSIICNAHYTKLSKLNILQPKIIN